MRIGDVIYDNDTVLIASASFNKTGMNVNQIVI